MILVITRRGDLHGSHLVNLLRQKGKEVVSLDYSEFPARLEISFSIRGTRRLSVLALPDGRKIASQEVESVLNRRQDKPQPAGDIRSERIREYIVQESQNFLDALPQLLECFWVSNPDAIRVATRKPYQLMVASEIGFLVPPTLVTNAPDEVTAFVDQLDTPGVVAKTLWSAGITIPERSGEKQVSFYSRCLSKAEVLAGIRRISNCPTILQPYIAKEFELRVTVVRDKVFACAIYSQQSDRAKEDWRRYDLPNTPHRVHQLPADVEQKCIRLLERLGLAFGCIDMIVTPDGDYVFLEINPNGQWLWIEQLTGLPISEAIFDLLTANL